MKPDLNLKDLNSHSYALWYIGDLFRRQAQRVRIDKVDKRGFTLDLRVNLQKVQIERLLIREINENMVGYTATADYANKKLELKLIANTTGRPKLIIDGGASPD